MYICRDCPIDKQQFQVDGTQWVTESRKESVTFFFNPEGEETDTEVNDTLDYGDSDTDETEYDKADMVCCECESAVEDLDDEEYEQWKAEKIGHESIANLKEKMQRKVEKNVKNKPKKLNR